MSIVRIAKCKNANTKKYRKIVSEIYFKFDELYKIMNFYAIRGSCTYIKLAYKIFEEEVGKDIDKY